MELQQFEELVTEAIAALPPVGKDAMENVGFVVEKKVRRKKARETGIRRGQTLLGLYEGVPKTKRGPHYYAVLPDKITIFQEAIEELANGDPERIRAIVFDTVWHEVGHHLGFNEHQLRAIEARKK